MNKIQGLLVASLAFNLVGIVFIGSRMAKKVGSLSPSPQPTAMPYIETPTYLDQKSTFSKLPRREANIIFAGDSITFNGAWDELLEVPALNRGIGGDSLEGLRSRIDEILEHHPQKLFLMIGINDLKSGRTREQVVSDYKKLVAYIRQASPKTQLLLQSNLPVNNEMRQAQRLPMMPPDGDESILALNEQLKRMADGEKVVYIDLYSKMATKSHQLEPRLTLDGLHLKYEGYAIWRDAVRPYVTSRR